MPESSISRILVEAGPQYCICLSLEMLEEVTAAMRTDLDLFDAVVTKRLRITIVTCPAAQTACRGGLPRILSMASRDQRPELEIVLGFCIFSEHCIF